MTSIVVTLGVTLLLGLAAHAVFCLTQHGAGKSALLSVLAGLRQPTRGRMLIDGTTAALLSLGSIHDPEMNGWENIEHARVLLGIPSRRRTLDLCARAGIVVFASHEPADLRSLCTSALWLEHGRVRTAGPLDAVLGDYERPPVTHNV